MSAYKRLDRIGVMGGGNNIKPPDSKFNFLPFKIKRVNGAPTVEPSFNLRTYAGITVAKTYYVKAAADGGNDSATGADEAHAFASINKALTRTDVDRVMVKAGLYGVITYPISHTWNNASPNRNVEVIGYGGDVISTSSIEFASLTWNKVDNHYEASYTTTVNRVRDGHILDAQGDHTKLTVKTSVAEVDGAAGSWFYDAAADLIYVRVADDRAPDADIYCYIGAPNGRIDDAVTYYIEDITFYGGTQSFLGSGNAVASKAYFKDCTFKYATGDCISFTGGGEVILQDCEISQCEADGIHLEVNTAQTANLILIDTTSRNNGLSTATNSNGYSRHGPGNTVVIGGHYYGNYGPNIKDINSDTYLWCLGVHNTTPACAADGAYNFGIGDTTATSKMWLDSCISDGTVTKDLYIGPSATAYIHNMTPASPTTNGGGTLATY